MIRVVLPLGKYGAARNTAHQGVGNMKHPNYHCSAALQHSFGAPGFFSLLLIEDVLLINSIVLMKIVLKSLFQPFSLSAQIHLAIQH